MAKGILRDKSAEALEQEVLVQNLPRDVPWADVGTNVSRMRDSDEMLAAAGLNWKLQRKNLGYTHNGKRMESKRQALIIDDPYRRKIDGMELTVIPRAGWHEVDNHEFFDFISEHFGSKSIISCGALNSYRMIWALVDMKEKFAAFGKDEHRSLGLFTLPHEYGRAINIRQTPVRIFCNNQISLSLRQKADYEISWSHRKEFEGSSVVRQLCHSVFEKYLQQYTYLGTKRYTAEKVKKYLSEVFPAAGGIEADPNNLSSTAVIADSVIDRQPGANIQPGSWLQIYNACTYTTNHLLGRDRSTALQALWYGRNRSRNLRALNLAIEFAKESKSI